MSIQIQEPIVALSTPSGLGALGLIRMTGKDCLALLDRIFKGVILDKAASHTAHFGEIRSHDDEVIDECVVTLFKGPKSFTGEDTAEISCHGSPYIIQAILDRVMSQGVRLARPGEFTQRAFLNGRLDLAQAEAVGDLIASQSSAQHQLAMHQMRGGVSDEMKSLREKLIKFASLIELENDFGEEDVEFADRTELVNLTSATIARVEELEATFQYGRAIKEGIAVAIVGRPNVGKSTLLNALLKEEKAIVSNVPGTTRDVIEDTIQIDGILFRFIDTAGIHETTDVVESIGIERSHEQIKKANVILWVEEIAEDAKELAARFNDLKLRPNQKAIIVLNKTDEFHTCHSYDVEEAVSTMTKRTPTLAMSALKKSQLEKLKALLIQSSGNSQFANQSVIISNVRHMAALQETREALIRAKDGLANSIPSDLVAIDIRHALHHLGEIAGTISTDDLLESIFRDFCIGK